MNIIASLRGKMFQTISSRKIIQAGRATLLWKVNAAIMQSLRGERTHERVQTHLGSEIFRLLPRAETEFHASVMYEF